MSTLKNLQELFDEPNIREMRKILFLLYQNPKGLSFEQLKNKTNYNSTVLASQIKLLRSYKVIHTDKTLGEKLYRLTSRGVEFTTSMILGESYAREINEKIDKKAKDTF